ncbi:hypothetical protein CPB84DRAFT_1769385 [Gymnopilus junonius]|uniref:Uncharacterized protein n=1 Tax=Gymnopilus junonius TaxID=109634 RepID=A0A9P5NUT1_GYMJU|nr:hypothetical protein CPB84DRAFT_1769385 [Gymnopilus junonius]
MPPKSKKSTKRAKLSNSELVHQSQPQKVFASTMKNNAQASKALELPLELLTEILSNFKVIPVPTTPTDPCTPMFYHILEPDYLERTDALRTLSQTSCASHSKSGAWYQVLGESLIRKSFLVTESQEIASHVRSMSVILSRYSTTTVLPAFVRAIEALPNLTTLQILRVHHQMTTPLGSAFEGHRFPQVRKVVCGHGHDIDASKLISAIAKECKQVEEVMGFNGNERLMKRLAKATPNLRSIKFTALMTAEGLRPLTTLKNVTHVTLNSYCATEEDALTNSQTLSAIKVAKDIKSILLQGMGYDYATGYTIHWSRNIGPDDH